MRGLWARAREGTDLDLRRGAYSAPGQEPLGTDQKPRERSGVAVARVAPVRPPLHVHFQVILQVPSHPGELMGDRDVVVAQVVRGSDAGEHEQLGRMEGAGGENDLPFRTKGSYAAIGRTHDAPRAAALQQDLPDDGVRADAEVGSRPRGLDERARGARALAPVDVPVEGAETFLLIAVDVLRHGKARRGARFNEGQAERIFHSVADRSQWTAAAAPRVFAPAVAFAASEVRQDFSIGPTGRAFLDPALVVEGMTPDVGHAVDRGRPAEPLAARLKDAPACEMPLRHRVVAPVPRAAFEVRSQGCRHADRPVIRSSPGLD